MKVQNNITIFTGDTQNNVQAEKAKAGQNTQGKNVTIYAGNLLSEFPLRDRLQQRRAQARERAMKIVGDTWDGDRKIDEQLERSREHVRELQASCKDAKDSIRELTGQGEVLMETYQVDPDSEEQQDLELLKKAQAERYPWSGVELTEEENERLAEIQGKELTEYQKRQLELNGNVLMHRETIFKAQRQIEEENAVIRGIRQERLKKDPMLEARKEAEEVMEAARDEAIGMIVDEAKDHIDEEQEKKEEEAEAIQEKKEEMEKIQDRRDEREKEMEELMGDMPLEELEDLKNAQTQMQQEIQDIVNRMNLVAEDIKGAQVDASL